MSQQTAQLASSRAFTATIAGLVGAVALGAISAGAVAIGALAIGRLALRNGHVRRLVIDDLEVGRLRVRELVMDQAPSPQHGEGGESAAR